MGTLIASRREPVVGTVYMNLVSNIPNLAASKYNKYTVRGWVDEGEPLHASTETFTRFLSFISRTS